MSYLKKKRLLFLCLFLGLVSNLEARERYHYFSSPAYVHSFQDLEAKIWVLIDQIPGLEWKEIVIPPARNKVTLLPKVILLSGKFQRPGRGKRSLIVNGTRVKLSEQGDFVLRVLTQGSEFGILVAIKDLDQKEEVYQTVGMRIFSQKKELKEIASFPKVYDFAGTYVFSQRKVASLNSSEASDALYGDLKGLSPKDPFNLFEIFLGASLGDFKQEDFYTQSPRSSFLRFNFERSLAPVVGFPLILGADGRFSLVAINQEPSGTLQFVNPELKVGIGLVKKADWDWSLFTGTNYYSSFGNEFLGASSLWGQSLSSRVKWNWNQDWGLDLYARLIYFPELGASFLSSREVLGGVGIRRGARGAFSWGAFSELAQANFQLNQLAETTFIRFGFMASF